MMRVEWDARLSVGVRRFDAHHKILIGIINEFGATMASDADAKALFRTLYRLLIYAHQHFAAEERVMYLHVYPGADAHRLEHSRMLAEVNALLARAHGGERPTEATAAFLTDWLTCHILAVDNAYREHLSTRGVR